MTMRRSFALATAVMLAVVTLVTVQAQRQGGAGGPGTAQAGAGRGGGGGDAPTLGAGNLIAGVWGSDVLSLDSRGWGWMTQSYVSSGYKRPFYNKAKELLFSGKQVTS